MTDDDFGPSDARMGELLREARPMPALPAGFRGAVWRRIQRSEPGAHENASGFWVDWLVGLLLRPRIAWTGLVGVVLVSGAAGLVQGTAAARQTAQERYLTAVAPFVVR